jgi:hypothetical protein
MSGQKDERAEPGAGGSVDPEREADRRRFEEDRRRFEEDRRRFEEDLETRGEAAPAGDDGELPPGVTHEVKDDGTVKRRRYSAG